jgi:hypothetical protein
VSTADGTEPEDPRPDASGQQDGGPSAAGPPKPPGAHEYGRRLHQEWESEAAPDLASLLEAAIDALSGWPGAPTGGANFFIGYNNLRDAVAGRPPSVSPGSPFAGSAVYGTVGEALLGEMTGAFAEPQGYERLRAALERRSVAVLRAPRGWGKTTTALHVLRASGCGTLQRLAPDALETLAGSDMGDGTGYLLDGMSVHQAARTARFTLDRIAGMCGDHGSLLVITVDDDVPLRPDVARDYTVTLEEPPDPRTVVEAHLARALGERDAAGELRRELLGRQAVQDLLDLLGEDGLGVGSCVELSARLDAVLAGTTTLEEVRGYFENESRQGFRAWFDAQDDVDQRAFVIALAVLNGLDYYTVSAAARALADSVPSGTEPGPDGQGRRNGGEREDGQRQDAGGGPRPDSPGPSRGLFGRTRTERLAAARAEVFPTVQPSPYGPVHATAVRFRDPSHVWRVVDLLWTEFDEAQPVVLRWLARLGRDRRQDVNVHAGAVVGAVAAYQLDHVLSEVVTPWAGSADPGEQAAALGALRVAVRQPRLSGPLRQLVARWAGDRGGGAVGNRRRTAARALGASVGSSDPRWALRNLRRLAGVPDQDLAIDISRSVTELFMDREQDLTGRVLGALSRWYRSQSPTRRACAGTCFLALAHDVAVDLQDGGGSWPALLWLADRSEQDTRTVADLWNHAWNLPRFSSYAMAILRTWVERAGQDPALAEPLAAVLRPALRDPSDTEMVRYELRFLRDGTGKSAHAAAQVLDLLDRATPATPTAVKDPS